MIDNRVKNKLPVSVYRVSMKVFKRNIEAKYGAYDLPSAKREKYISVKNDRKAKERMKIDGNVEEKTSMYLRSLGKEQKINQILAEGKNSFETAKVILNPYEMTPLTALVLFHEEEPQKIKVTVKGKDGAKDYVYTVEGTECAHRIPIFGLYANFENHVVMERMDSVHESPNKKEFTIWTEPLPEIMEEAVKVKKHQVPSALPFILVAGKSTPFPFAFDEQGEIRYLLTYRPRGYGLFPLANGHFIVIDRAVLIPTYQIPHSTQMYEMDYFGRVHREYHIPKGVHHDVYEMVPGGNLLLVSNSNQGHMEDVIVELDRSTGEIVKSLDTRKIFKAYYRDRINWVHVNSLHYSPEDQCVTFCARNLHTIVKIDWRTNKVKWLLCDPYFWEGTTLNSKVLKPEGTVEWHYQAHSVLPLTENLDGNPDTSHVMIYDNHWSKRRKIKTFQEDENSYVRIYTIDEKKMTVSMEKSYAGVKSKITSNGILCYDKKRVFSMGAYLEPLVRGRGGMICEYDYDSAEVLNQYSIRFFFYRAHPFCPNKINLTEKLEADCDLVRGVLILPKAHANYTEGRGARLLPEGIRDQEHMQIYRVDTILYVKARDHAVESVVLESNSMAYVRDLSEPKQTQEEYFGNMIYAVAIPLQHMNEGIYKIRLRVRGEWYSTGENVIVHATEKK